MVFGLLWGPLVRLPGRPQEPYKLSKSRCRMVLELRFSIGAFFEDVRNEITTFASPKDAQIGAKSLQSPLPLVVNQFQTTVISRTDF